MMNEIDTCPVTLTNGFNTYSPKGLRELFNGRRANHLLGYVKKDTNKQQQQLLLGNRKRISISGVQEKYSFKLEKGTMVLTTVGGTHIVKPIPMDLELVDDVPANEHLTMQIAAQVYKIEAAKCGLIFFADGKPAYITKRFDVLKNGDRCLKEDFASVLQKTEINSGKNFKYESSYLQMAQAIDVVLPSSILAKEKLFQLAVFNYLFSNGDAHLKNFSIVDYELNGYYQLAPAYDLMNTRLHMEDGDFALEDRLYEKDYLHPSYSHFGYHAYDDFYDFGKMMHIKEVRIKRMLDNFLLHTEDVQDLVDRSFLSAEAKQLYMKHYHDKLRRLNNSLMQKTTTINE